MEYKKVVRDILLHYSGILTKEELIKLKDILIFDDVILSNNNIELINSILNKIWNKVLTNPNEYVEGEDFCFLVKFINEPYDDTDWNYLSDIKMITNETIKNIDIHKQGIIVTPKFESNNKIFILPTYNLKTLNYNIMSLFSINPLFKDICVYHEGLTEKSKEESLPILYINKILYNKNTITDSDYYEILVEFIYNYFCSNELDLNIYYKVRDNILKKNKLKELITKYINDEINFDELESFINNIIEKEFNNLTNKKIK